MNTEATQESNAAQTTGERLRNAREQLGLSQQIVAERLCLKVSTVRDIEDNKTPEDLASTFLRGYIRSYARLVRIPEQELLPMMAEQAPIRASKVEVMQSYSLGKRRKKRDGWLMSFTCLILFVVLGLTGAWWWQNHKAQQAEITTLVDQSSGEFSVTQNEHVVPLNHDESAEQNTNSSVPSQSETSSADNNAAQVSETTASNTSPQSGGAVSQSQTSIDNLQTNAAAAVTPASLPTGQAEMTAAATTADSLAMTFNQDCWLEVSDAAGKKLFSGTKRKGDRLELTGHTSYKLKIGAPAAVQIQFQGKPVDLSRFIRTNQVARLTVSAE